MNLQIPLIVAAAAGKRLVWDVDKDHAVLTVDGTQASDGNPRKAIWSGSLLPAFELVTDWGANYVKAAVSAMKTTPRLANSASLSTSAHMVAARCSAKRRIGGCGLLD